MLSAGYSAVGRPLPGAGLGTEPIANIGVMVSQMVPYPGKRQLRAAIAAREADAEAPQVDAARLSVIARVTQAYHRLAYTYAVADVLARNRDLLETLLEVTENRYAVGAAAQQDVMKAQTQLTVLELQVERVRQERARREGELNALLARQAGTAVGRPADLQWVPFDASLSALIDLSLASAPMVRRDQIMIDRARLAVDAARREYKPDFGVSGGYFFMGAMPPMYELRVDVTLPLQRARRAAAVAEQESTAEQSVRVFDGTRLSLQARVTEEFQMAATSSRLARLYRDTVLPQAHLTLESSMSSYQTGSGDVSSLLTNFAAVLEYEMTYFDELAAYHAAVSRLEEMTGAPLAH